MWACSYEVLLCKTGRWNITKDHIGQFMFRQHSTDTHIPHKSRQLRLDIEGTMNRQTISDTGYLGEPQISSEVIYSIAVSSTRVAFV